MRSTSGCTPRSASCSWRRAALREGGPPGGRWRGGGRRCVAPSRSPPVGRTYTGSAAGPERLGDGTRRGRAPHGAAGRSVHGRGAGRPHPPSTRSAPFHGEGYRKAWAKLRVERIRTSQEPTVDAASTASRRTARVMHTARRHMVERSPRQPPVTRMRDGRRGGDLRLRGRR